MHELSVTSDSTAARTGKARVTAGQSKLSLAEQLLFSYTSHVWKGMSMEGWLQPPASQGEEMYGV